MRAQSTMTAAATMVMLGLTAAATADARQRPVTRSDVRTASAQAATNLPKAPRWGGRTDGRWWAGSRAPGGWAAYQRPLRGSALPAYWAVPQWQVRDWSAFDLPAPPAGQRWTRYYDDAVLVDGRGIVHDTIGGVDWDQLDPAGVDYAYRSDWAGDAGVSQVSVVPNRAAPGTSYPVPQRARETVSVGSVAAPNAVTVAPNRPTPAAPDPMLARDRATVAAASTPMPTAAPMPNRAAPGAPYPVPGRDRGTVSASSVATPSAPAVAPTPAAPIAAAADRQSLAAAVPPAAAVQPAVPATAVSPVPVASRAAARSTAAASAPGAGYPVPPPGGWADPAPVATPYPPAVATRAPAPVAATAYPPAVATRAAPYREPVVGAPPLGAPPLGTPALGAPPPIVTASNGARVETTTREVAPGYYSNGYYYPPQTIVTVTVHPQPVGTASPR